MQIDRTPEGYRERAAEHRRRAEAESDPELMAQLVLIAKAYEELAALCERAERSK
jgi:hypothetical protein